MITNHSARSTALAFFAVLVAGCSHETAPASSAAAPAGTRRERVSIDVVPIRESADQDMRNSRAGLLRMGDDERDALTAPFPGEMTIELPASGSDQFASALALTGYPKDKPPPHVRLEFDFDFVGPQRTSKTATSLGFAEALSTWSSIQQPRGTDAPVKMILRGKWIGEDVPKNLPPLRMCLALPEMAAITKPADDRPNVLIISVDTLRADHLSCMGYARPTSPHIDALVARGALFEHAYSSAPWTLPSYGSLFTGLLPADHRAGIVREREAEWGTDATSSDLTTDHLRADVPTLAELLSQRGYQTVGFVCNPFLAAGAGVARGFQQYTSYQYTSMNGVDLALEWIGSRIGTRWFVFLHVIDPHMPYAPPMPFDTRFSKQGIDDLKSWPPDLKELRAHEPDAATKQLLIDEYDGEIASMDEQVGRLIDGLEKGGALSNTLIVFHSDHGEEFWEHGSCDHGHTQFDELLHVPFALVLPGKIQAGQRVTTRVRTLDLLPTIGAYAGFDAPPGIEGKSLVPVLEGRETADRDDVSEAILHGSREIKALMQGRQKLIASGAATNQLYDIAADPKEASDRAQASAALVKTMRAVLEAHHESAKAAADKTAPIEYDEGTRHRLSGTGYGGVGEPAPKPPKKP